MFCLSSRDSFNFKRKEPPDQHEGRQAWYHCLSVAATYASPPIVDLLLEHGAKLEPCTLHSERRPASGWR